MSLVSHFTQPDAQAAYFVEFLEQLDQQEQIRALRTSTAERLVPAPGRTVLDLGCGIGAMAFLLAARSGMTGTIAGVDISSALIEVARRKAGDRRGVEFHVADALAIPYPTGFFDAAYSERVFLYLPDRLAALEELRRVVKPGGQICLVDTDFDSTAIYSGQKNLTRQLTNVIAAAIPNPDSGRELPALVKRAGFKDIQVETFALTTPYQFLVHAARGVLDRAVERGAFGKAEVDSWWDEQARLHEAGDFLHVWLFVRVTATV